jgi:hypothetical protein
MPDADSCGSQSQGLPLIYCARGASHQPWLYPSSATLFHLIQVVSDQGHGLITHQSL